MSNKTALWCTAALWAAMAAVTAAVYGHLPTVMVTHWGADNTPNGTMSRPWGALFPLLLTAGIAALLWFLPLIDPRRRNYAAFRSTYNVFVVGLVAFLAYVDFLTLAWNLGYRLPLGRALAPGLGAIFVLTGLLLRKARPNWFVGIRTPWTLSSTTVWEKTHRLAAPAFILSGVVTAAGVFGTPLLWGGLGLVLLSAALAVVYSYLAYEEERKRA